MLDRLLPQRFDNDFRGPRLALWLFAAVLVVRTGMAIGAIFDGRAIATSADAVPLDAYGAGGAQAVIALFALWGVAQFALCLLGVLALARYRAMTPLVLALFLAEHLGRRLALVFLPIERSGGSASPAINVALIALTFVALALALRARAT